MNGLNTQSWSKYDDPTSASNNILIESKKLGCEVDCPPSKLKSGWGEGPCLLLNKLLDKTLK